MASEPVECQVVLLRVSIHCEGCKKKVKKVLLHIDGVYRCDIDARRNRVAVTASTKIDAGILVARLRKSGKLAEPWPEEPKQQQEPPPPAPAESQSQETKNPTDDASKPNEAAEKTAPAAAAEPSNAQPTAAPEPEKTTNETPPPAQESKEPDAAKAETGPQQRQPSEANGKQQQQQQHHDHDDKPVDARVTMEFDDARSRGIYGYGAPQHYMPATRQAPVHVMSYNVARPMASSSYYAAAPTPAAMPMPMPMPMSRPGPSQGGYIDEYAPPNYYSRPAPSSYGPYYYPDPQPSAYGHHQRSAAEDYYYGAPPPPPQRSAFSPPREAYGDMFNDENANSCSVM